MSLRTIDETRLDGTISDSEVHIDNYHVIRHDRPINGRNEGRVCIYIRTNISFMVRTDLETDKLESLLIEIRKPRSKPFLITTRYRPPSSPIELFTHFEELIGRIDSENIEHIILGDFNCNLLTGSNSNNDALLNIADIYNLNQLICDPTRVTPTSKTLTDLIFTNYPDNIASGGVFHVSISDHSLVYVYRKLFLPPETGTKSICIRHFKNFKRENFCNIQAQAWNDLEGIENPNEMWIKWKLMFLEVCDKHAPMRTRHIGASKSPCINSDLKRIMYHRDRLKLISIKSNLPLDWSNYKKTRNRVNTEIRNAKRCYYDSSFEKHANNSRKI